MEKAMAPHSSTLAWKIPWMEELGGLQSTRSLRVRHDWATSLSRIGEGNGNPLECSWLENPRDGGAWWAAIYGVAQSRTWLKWLSSSSSRQRPGESNVHKDGILRSISLSVSLLLTPSSHFVLLLSHTAHEGHSCQCITVGSLRVQILGER